MHSLLDRLVKDVPSFEDGPLDTLKEIHLSQCESCLEGKMTKRSFRAKGTRANDLLEIVHTDICGPMNVRACGRF